MYCKKNSDATYCSEVEELIEADNLSCKHLPLRRSQRLSQKFKMTAPSSEKNKLCCSACRNSQNIFVVHNKKEERAIAGNDLAYQHISSSKKVKRAGKDVQFSSAWRGVPLDLSKKSKESAEETPQMDINVASMFDDIESCNAKNVLKVTETDCKESSQLVKQSKEKCKRRKKSVSKDGRKPSQSLDAFKDISSTKNIPFDVERGKLTKITKQSILPSNKKSFNTKNVTTTHIKAPKIKNPQNKSVRIPDYLPNINRSENIVPQNNKANLPVLEKQNKPDDPAVPFTECIKNRIAYPFIKVSESSANSFGNKAFIPKNVVDVKLSEDSLKLKLNPLNETTNNIRSNKRKHLSGENVVETKNDLKKLQQTHQNKSEAPTSGKRNDFQKILGIERVFKGTAATKKLNILAARKCLKGNKKAKSNDFKSKRTLRSGTATTNKGQPSEPFLNIENQGNCFENEFKKLKMEIFSQKSFEENVQTNIFQEKIRFPIANQLSGQNLENKLSVNEFKTKGSNISGDSRKTPSFFPPVKPSEINFPIKSEKEIKQPIFNTNYMKSFDRNQFLNKIQNNRSYFEKNSLTKINTFEIPPSPADSSDDPLRNSILLNVYPPHFKHQLPPEAVLTRSLDPQPLPTPEDTVSTGLLDSSSSSPSLPESLCELFKTKDIKNILNVERTSYHLYIHHIQALALILNLRLEYLLNILDKLMNTNPSVLKNVDKALKTPFAPDTDLFPKSPDDMWESSYAVPNSQSPKQRRISKISVF